MTEFQFNFVRDGNGGQIKFPIFISQADMDLINKEFVVEDEDVFVVTYPRSGTTWTEQMVHLLVNKGEQGGEAPHRCRALAGNIATSSRWHDRIFEDNATPPPIHKPSALPTDAAVQ